MLTKRLINSIGELFESVAFLLLIAVAAKALPSLLRVFIAQIGLADAVHANGFFFSSLISA
jgi:hypothetical protein